MFEIERDPARARLKSNYSRHFSVRIPSFLSNTVPPEWNKELVVCVDFENRARSMAEGLLQLAFCSLPYATTPMLASENMKSIDYLVLS